jgi:predicted HTH domain antitoxin
LLRIFDKMQIEINDTEFKERGYSEQDIKELIAMAFYEKHIWGSAKAAAFCNIERLAFQKKLAEKEIPFQFDDTYWREELGSIDKIVLNDDGGE